MNLEERKEIKDIFGESSVDLMKHTVRSTELFKTKKYMFGLPVHLGYRLSKTI